MICSFSYLELVCCSMSSSNSCFLICIQISQVQGMVVWYSRLLKYFPQFVVIHTVKDFSIIMDIYLLIKSKYIFFLELSCFCNDPTDVGSLISGFSAFSKSTLNIQKFIGHVLLKLGWRILSITLLSCEMSATVW